MLRIKKILRTQVMSYVETFYVWNIEKSMSNMKISMRQEKQLIASTSWL